jgi:hypothetical protein
VREFDKPIGRVWRRMRLQRFLAALVWCWCAALALAAVAIAVEKLTKINLPGSDWVPFAIAGGLGALIAAAVALFTGPNRVDAAVAIDRAFHLNERLSTTLTLPQDLRQTPAGRALVADTLKHISGLDVGAQFGLRMPRLAWVPLIPAALAVGMLFLPEVVQRTARASRTPELVNKEYLVKQSQAIKKSVAEKRKELSKDGLSPETDRLLAQIEKAADKLAKAPTVEKDKAMVELNKLTDQLKEQQKRFGSSEQIKRQLQQLQQMANNGPADEFAKDLAKGDFQKAAQDLKQLQEKLVSGKMTEAEKKQLKDQITQMKEQLEKLANLDQRKKQLDEALKNGGLTKQQYEQQMAKLNEDAKNLKKLQQLASKLGSAQNALTQNDVKKAAEALGMGQKELDQMAQQLKELETLDQALADLQDAKNGMASDGMNQLGQQIDGAMNLGQGMRNPGIGMGRGRGQGDRPEAPDNTAFYNTKTKAQLNKGKAIVEGTGPYGRQLKGESFIDVQAESEAAGTAAAEALSNQKIPNNVKKHVLGYFDEIRTGK